MVSAGLVDADCTHLLCLHMHVLGEPKLFHAAPKSQNHDMFAAVYDSTTQLWWGLMTA